MSTRLIYTGPLDQHQYAHCCKQLPLNMRGQRLQAVNGALEGSSCPHRLSIHRIL